MPTRFVGINALASQDGALTGGNLEVKAPPTKTEARVRYVLPLISHLTPFLRSSFDNNGDILSSLSSASGSSLRAQLYVGHTFRPLADWSITPCQATYVSYFPLQLSQQKFCQRVQRGQQATLDFFPKTPWEKEFLVSII